MTFDKQVKKAEEEKLKARITRDLTFIILGIIFLIISILISTNKNNNENNNINENKVTTTINQK